MSGADGQAGTSCTGVPDDADEASWIDTELAGCALGDKRLCDRLRRLLHRLEGAVGAPLSLACQDWANTKAAYRFLSSERIREVMPVLQGEHRHRRGNARSRKLWHA